MTPRCAIHNIWLRRISSQIVSGNRVKYTTKEQDEYLVFSKGRELYNPKLIMKNYGIIPLLIVIFGGVFALGSFTVRNAMTRDDVRYSKNGKFGYEKEENLDRPRKFRVYKQKYKCPDGLRELFDGMKKG